MSALDLTSNSGRNGKQGTQGLKERVKDRKPPPIKLIKTIKNSDTLTTPDLAKAIQTPDLRKILSQNNQELGGTVNFAGLSDITGNIKEEIPDGTPLGIQSKLAKFSTEKTADDLSPQEIDSTGRSSTNMNDNDPISQIAIMNGQETVMTQTNALIMQKPALPTVPVDMREQETEKVERKRQRNRVAATKCRKRKIERITVLEGEVRELNESLQEKLTEKRKLELEVEEYRNRIRVHVKQGCKNLEEYLMD